MRTLRSFFARNDGLTTIEWVALCAIILGAAFAVSASVTGGSKTLGTSVANKMVCASDNPPASCP